jgi:magnesium transporter
MNEDSHLSEHEDLQQRLAEVQQLIERHRAGEISGVVAIAQQNLEALRHKLDGMHPADVAYILEALPLDERLLVWELLKAEREGEILLEVSDAVRESIIETMDRKELVAAAETLDADELAD